MSDKDYDLHDLASIFPLYSDSEYRELVSSIETNGLRDPIVLFEGKILDGRNRYLACCEVDVEPRYIDFAGDDPIEFVIDRNLRRRHLNASQRAMIASRLATFERGAN